MEKEFVSIEFKDLNLAQLLFVQAVVMPEITALLDRYAKDLVELGVVE